jgi:hypothetical protein
MTNSTSSPGLEYVSQTELPVIGFTLVLILCIYLAFRAYREFTTENKLKSAMYAETGITSSYEYTLPEDEKVCFGHTTSSLIFQTKFNQTKAYLVYLKANGSAPESGAKLEISLDRARDILRSQLGDEEKKKIRTALVRWMIGTIEVLAKVERDRPGAARLYEKKLVSEEYWQGVQECFAETHSTIEEIRAEAEFIEPGWGGQIFQQALQLWRVTKIREKQREEEASASAGSGTPPS